MSGAHLQSQKGSEHSIHFETNTLESMAAACSSTICKTWVACTQWEQRGNGRRWPGCCPSEILVTGLYQPWGKVTHNITTRSDKRQAPVSCSSPTNGALAHLAANTDTWRFSCLHHSVTMSTQHTTWHGCALPFQQKAKARISLIREYVQPE